MQKNNDTLISRLIVLLSLTIIGTTLQAQVLPGDADNNGGVENVDYLYIGYSYGQTGAARLEESTTPQEQSIQTVWNDFFPSGLNFAFADANGDGIINYLDLLTTAQNYGVRQPGYTPPIYFHDDDEGIPVGLDQRSIPPMVTQGTQLEVPLLIGNEESPTESFNGIAFTIEYNPVFIRGVGLDFSESWLGDSTNLFRAINTPEEGKIEVALTKFGDNPSYGKGLVAKVNFIVIDDLVAWLITPNDSLETNIKISKVVYKSAGFNTRPTKTEDVRVMLYHPDALLAGTPSFVPEAISIVPNPTRDITIINSEFTIQKITLFNVSGQKIFTQQCHQKSITLDHLSQLGNGIYFIKIETTKGTITKKLLVQE